MYSKKYLLEKIEEQGEKKNPIYENKEGAICYLAYLKEGERGWFLVEDDEYKELFMHRIHTSEIKKIEYSSPQIFMETQNTKFVFKEWKE